MKIRKSLCFALCCILGLLLISCQKVNQDPKNENPVKTEQEKVYDLYVSYAQASGETPQSYEEWLASIKGPKGDKGDTGPAGPQGPQGEPGTGTGTGASIKDVVISYDFNDQGQSVMVFTFIMSNGENIVKEVIVPKRITYLDLEQRYFTVIKEGEEEPKLYAHVSYEDGTSGRIEITKDLITDGTIDFRTVGDYYFTVMVQGYERNLYIEVYDPNITTVKSIYFYGDLSSYQYNGFTYTEGVTLEEITTQIKSLFIGSEIELQYFDDTSKNVNIDESMLDLSKLDATKIGEQTIYLEVEGYKVDFPVNIEPDYTKANLLYTVEVTTLDGSKTVELYDNGYYRENNGSFDTYTIDGTTLAMQYYGETTYYTLDLTNPDQPVANIYNFENDTKVAEYTFTEKDYYYTFVIYDNNIIHLTFMRNGEKIDEIALNYKIEGNILYVMGTNFIIYEDGHLEMQE